MGKPAIFLRIFGVFYLVNLVFSRILDYSDERKDLCKIAGIHNRECTQEEKALIKEAYKARQKAENERERADREEAEAHGQRERAVAAEVDKGSEEKKVWIRDVAVGLQSRIKAIRELVFPNWLKMNNKSDRFERFLLALTIPNTQYSIKLQPRLVAAGITAHDFAVAIEKFDDNSSTRFNHSEKVRTPKSDKEWEELYNYFEATNEYEKVTIGILLEDLPLSAFEHNNRLAVAKRYFILLDNVDYTVTENDVKKLFGSINCLGTTDILIVRENGVPTGYVAVNFISKRDIDVDQLRTDLLAYGKKPFNDRYFDVKISLTS